MITNKNWRTKNITVPYVKSKNPYGHIEVVSPKDQKIKPNERITKANLKRQNRTFKPSKK